MQQDTLEHPEMSSPFTGPAAPAVEHHTAKPAACPPGCLPLAGCCQEGTVGGDSLGGDRRDTVVWLEAQGVVVMGPGLLGEPPQAQGLTVGDAGWRRPGE